MNKQIAAACLLGTALVAAPAFAQDMNATSNATSASQTSGQFLTQMDAQQWRGSKLVGVDVYGTDNSKIGDINEVIVDRNGQARAIVIGVGGFLGIGEKNVAIPWDKVQWNAGGSQASSGAMTSSVSTGAGPAGDRSTPRDIAQTTTGAPADSNAQPAQSAAAGGAALSSAPSSGTTANAPANSSSSAASAPNSTAMTGSNSATTTSTSTSTSSASGSASSASGDYPDRAMVSMSKQDLQNAPEFRYASQASSASGSGMTGGTGSSSAR